MVQCNLSIYLKGNREIVEFLETRDKIEALIDWEGKVLKSVEARKYDNGDQNVTVRMAMKR